LSYMSGWSELVLIASRRPEKKMARLLFAMLGDDSHGANSTSKTPGVLYMLGVVAATISIMVVVICNCGKSHKKRPKPQNSVVYYDSRGGGATRDRRGLGADVGVAAVAAAGAEFAATTSDGGGYRGGDGGG
ncbi:hypothetical protein B296_00021751, partial [Ensete ventricosum]